MAQHDYDVANGSGAVVRADINDVLEAIATGNSGASAPSVTFAFMRWFDTSNNILKVRNAANTAWINVLPDITATNGGLAALATANLFTALQKFTKGADIASASTLVIGTDGNYFDITGTTTITAMTVAAGALFVLQFDGALTLTDGASLELGSENVLTAAGDHAVFYATAANTVMLLAYRSATGSPKPPSQSEAEAGTATIPRPWTAERVSQAINALAAGGGLVPLQRQTGSAVAAYDFTTGIGSTYRSYKLIGWLRPATDQVDLWLRVSDDAGVSYEADASDYAYQNQGYVSNTSFTNYSGGDSKILLTTSSTSDLVSNVADDLIEFEITFHVPSSTTQKKHFQWRSTWFEAAGTNMANNAGAGCLLASTNIEGVRLLFSSGNIAAGDVTLYGIENA